MALRHGEGDQGTTEGDAEGSARGKSQRIGYARVSTATQNLDSQLDALHAADCSRVFEDTISGTSKERPGWDALLEHARAGDTLVITELSRMSRSLLHMLQVVADLEEREIGIVSLRESIDTTTATGRLFLSVMGAVSQMERELRAERAAAGRAAARARGRSGGRPRTPREKLEKARRLYESETMNAAEGAAAAGVSRRALFRYLAEVRQAAEATASPSSLSERSPSPVQPEPAPVKLLRFGTRGYRWDHYTVESARGGWLVREHDDARRLLGGELVERAFNAEGVSAKGSAKLAKLDLAGAGNSALYGWKHLCVSKGASAQWLIDALWTLDGEPVDAVQDAQHRHTGVGGSPEHDHLAVVGTLAEAREQVPGLAGRSLRDRGRRFVRLR